MEGSQAAAAAVAMDQLDQQIPIAVQSYAKAIEGLRQQEAMFTKYESDYQHLHDTLSNLTDKTSYTTMVPIGPLAFMPGKLVHTNEILVMLGDNWFAERSAKQAKEIVERRLEFVEEQLKGIETQLKATETRYAAILGWKKEMDEYGDEIVDITEEYHSDESEEVESSESESDGEHDARSFSDSVLDACENGKGSSGNDFLKENSQLKSSLKLNRTPESSISSLPLGSSSSLSSSSSSQQQQLVNSAKRVVFDPIVTVQEKGDDDSLTTLLTKPPISTSGKKLIVELKDGKEIVPSFAEDNENEETCKEQSQSHSQPGSSKSIVMSGIFEKSVNTSSEQGQSSKPSSDPPKKVSKFKASMMGK